ncbi:ABC transporter permease [Geminicoccus roseus]|uniref:ABC transporter permease n=1 Tax=Geminicoccus roseus TaxID=404900 RepID=UPI00041CF15B|nr:ABC transporter permease [Geminicoccus roseus]
MSTAPVYERRPTGPRHQDFLARHAQVLSIAAFFALMVLLFSTRTDAFLSQINLLNLLRQSAPLLIVAVAMTFVITTGGIDLSVGSTVALVNALVALALQAGIPWPLAVLAMLLLGALVGLIQGWFVAREGIPAFIVTLAGLSILRGVALLLTQGFSIPIDSSNWFVQLGRGWILGMPLPAMVAILVMVLGAVVLASTRFGRYVTAIGANAEAARRAGIGVQRVTMAVYVLTGTAAALAGIIIAARLGSGSSNAAVGFELDVIAAVVLGGTSLMGGRGSILGTCLGGLTIAVIGNGLILAHISPFFTQIVTGLIILAAIWLNTKVFRGGRRQ